MKYEKDVSFWLHTTKLLRGSLVFLLEYHINTSKSTYPPHNIHN